MTTISVVQILTASIAPVIVISGIGLLLLSITNRYGRVIDRARHTYAGLGGERRRNSRPQALAGTVRLTHQRAKLLRASMIYGSASIFFVSLMVLSLFGEHVSGAHFDYVALPFFTICLISLVLRIYYSIRDITISLRALNWKCRASAAGAGKPRSLDLVCSPPRVTFLTDPIS